MFFPPSGKVATATNTADILINKHEFLHTVTNSNILVLSLPHHWKMIWLSNDKSIKQVVHLLQWNAYYIIKIYQQDFQLDYDTTDINILLWGCKSWALTEELQRKLEVCHHRFLRKIIGITIFDVKDHHTSSNQVREELNNCYTFHQSLELKRARWLEKLSLMSCKQGPRNILLSWIYKKSRKQGGQQQQISTSLSNTLTDSLHFETDQLNDWMLEAKLEPWKWANQIETALNLVCKTYVSLKLRKW